MVFAFLSHSFLLFFFAFFTSPPPKKKSKGRFLESKMGATCCGAWHSVAATVRPDSYASESKSETNHYDATTPSTMRPDRMDSTKNGQKVTQGTVSSSSARSTLDATSADHPSLVNPLRRAPVRASAFPDTPTLPESANTKHQTTAPADRPRSPVGLSDEDLLSVEDTTKAAGSGTGTNPSSSSASYRKGRGTASAVVDRYGTIMTPCSSPEPRGSSPIPFPDLLAFDGEPSDLSREAFAVAALHRGSSEVGNYILDAGVEMGTATATPVHVSLPAPRELRYAQRRFVSPATALPPLDAAEADTVANPSTPQQQHKLSTTPPPPLPSILVVNKQHQQQPKKETEEHPVMVKMAVRQKEKQW